MTKPLRRDAGFTLIEILAAVLLTSIVLTVAVNIFINISDATTAATARMREIRHAVAILDRVAHDLEAAFLLVKPPEMDPLDHPWLFLGESEFSEGSDRLKFVIQTHQRRGSTANATGLSVVTYALTQSESDSFNLVRSANPNLPDRLDRYIPTEEEEGAMLLAEGVESFSVRFLGENGGWTEQWDSSQIIDSGALPIAAEISIAFVDANNADDDFDSEFDGDFDDALGDEDSPYTRRVAIPIRPVPMQQLLDEYIADVQSGGDGRGGSKGRGKGRGVKSSAKARRGECEMTFPECAIRNQREIEASMSRRLYETWNDCFEIIPNLCVEDEKARKICGVSVSC